MSFLRSVPTTILRSQARATAFTTHQRLSISSMNATRSFHNHSSLRLPYKDDQDRKSLKPKSTEGTKSGTDNETAQSAAAFDGSKTSPEEAHDAAETESDGNSLDASGANQSKSKPLGGDGGGEMKSTTKGQNEKPSGHGSPQKSGKPPGA